jgi:RNA polymerase sigma factor (sigma-70 family)
VRAFRFGVNLLEMSSEAGWAATCRRAEALGYDVVMVADHLGMPAPFPALVAAAAATTRPRLSVRDRGIVRHLTGHPSRASGESAILAAMTSRSAAPGRLPDVGQQPFEAIVTRYGPTVLRVCRAVVGPNAAEDAWSETFLAALQAYPDLRPGSNVEAWLVTIAHRKAIDQLRAASRRAVPTADLPETPAATGQPGGWESDLWTALRVLPLKQRQSVAYHHLAGLPYAEVAEILGGTPEAARRAAADGIAALRKTYLQGATR